MLFITCIIKEELGNIFLGGPLRRSFTHFVSSRDDYCNSLPYGLPAYQLNKQRVQNAAARLIFQESKYCHVRPLLYNLHWLPVKFRIDFKILLLTYKAINGLAPFYLQTLTMLGDRSFAAAAPQLWNSLPYAMMGSPSVASFKKTLKIFSERFFVILCAFVISFLGFMQFFYDLSSLGNFYSFSVDIIVLTLVGRVMQLMHVYFIQP